ncbi:MAG: hypothetical protein ACXADY_19420 [Candidatus Hodarchaeales archaeon]|jgi:ABC-type proline/glycine betaine transport system permease subunit
MRAAKNDKACFIVILILSLIIIINGFIVLLEYFTITFIRNYALRLIWLSGSLILGCVVFSCFGFSRDEKKFIDDSGILCLAFFWFVLQCMFFFPFTVDDAFISFKYSQNLAKFGELSFNQGDKPLEAYSNFFWIILFTPLTYFNFDVIIISKIIGISSGFLLILITRKITQQLVPDHSYPSLSSLGVVIVPWISLWAVGGLETIFYITVLTSSILFFLEEIKVQFSHIFKYWKTCSALLITSLTRIDGIILALALCIIFSVLIFFNNNQNKSSTRTFSEMKPWLASLLIFIPVYGIYTVWRLFYFKDLFPSSFYALQGSSSLELFFSRSLVFLPLIIFLFPFIIIIELFFIKKGKIEQELTLFLIIIVLVGVISIQVRSHMEGFRYALPAIPSLMVLAAIGLRNSRKINREYFKNNIFRKIVLFLILITLFIYSISPAIFSEFSGLRVNDQTPLDYGRGLENAHVKLGKWLGKYAYPDTVIAIQDVGAVPYYSGLRTVDIHSEGLLNKHTIDYGLDWNYTFSQEIDIFIFVSKTYIPSNLTEAAQNHGSTIKYIFLFYLTFRESSYILKVYARDGLVFKQGAFQDLPRDNL